MKSVSLGRTGLTVSQVGFGGIPITRRAFEDAVAVVRRALDAGITFLDTANGYLDSEEKIGRAIVGRRRESLVVASKSPASTKQGILEHVDLSLRRLRTDYLDLYQLHNLSRPEAWEVASGPGGALEGLQLAVEQGKVRHVGVTSHSLDLTETLLATGLFETVMVPFNMIVHEAADHILPSARAKNVAVIAMKPMAGGQLELEEVVQLAEASEPLTQAELEEIERMRREMGRLFCRRCGYCQPCPQGIPITNMMVFSSFMRRFGPEVAARRFGAGFEKAHSCEDCGQCEEKCPYHLPIRERIRLVIGLYESIRAGTYSHEGK
jgi:hypothetical protein